MNRRRVTTALCFQQQTMECGLAALAIVLRSFGRDVALAGCGKRGESMVDFAAI